MRSNRVPVYNQVMYICRMERRLQIQKRKVMFLKKASAVSCETVERMLEMRYRIDLTHFAFLTKGQQP